ncbi:hypothetical protein KKF84_04670 [Myxococcota bacterium]|nr:hypothetical protein [Myxococcota bacterium]MBU1534590.1 hypothetical protein [Myxococcota bacterium]
MQYSQIEITHSIVCPSCNTKNPLTGLQDRHKCYNCLQLIDLSFINIHGAVASRVFFGGYYDVITEALALLAENEEGSFSGFRHNGYTFQYKKRSARCHTCGTAFPLGEIVAAAGWVTCASCSEKTPVRACVGELADEDPRIAFVVGETVESGVSEARHPVSLNCSSCGGSLVADGTSRTAECKYCNNTNYLPDAVWRHIHPVPPHLPFYVVYQNDPLSRMEALVQFTQDLGGPGQPRAVDYFGLHGEMKIIPTGDRALKVQSDLQAAMGELLLPENLGLLERLFDGKACHDVALCTMLMSPSFGPFLPSFWPRVHPRIMEQLAKQPRLDVQLVNYLAYSDNPRVRQEMANRSYLAYPETLEFLLKDPDEKVREVLARQFDQPLSYYETLASDASALVRAALAGNKVAPGEILRKLRGDPDENVKTIARNNPAYEPGFFDRLLGR